MHFNLFQLVFVFKGELTVSDVFGLPGTSEREEFLISFTIPAAAQDGKNKLKVILNNQTNFELEKE